MSKLTGEKLVKRATHAGSALVRSVVAVTFCYAFQCGCVSTVQIRDIQGDMVFSQKSEIHLAAEEGDLDRLLYLLSKHASANEKDADLMSPVHYAAQNGHAASAELLLKHGADVNALNHLLETPLHMAVQHEYMNVVQLLVDRQADPLALDWKRLPPLHYAGLNNNREIIEYFASNGVSIVPVQGNTVLLEVTAKLHHFYGNYFQKGGRYEAARRHFSEAAGYYLRASDGFREISKDLRMKRYRKNTVAVLALAASAAHQVAAQNHSRTQAKYNARISALRDAKSMNQYYSLVGAYESKSTMPLSFYPTSTVQYSKTNSLSIRDREKLYSSRSASCVELAEYCASQAKGGNSHLSNSAAGGVK